MSQDNDVVITGAKVDGTQYDAGEQTVGTGGGASAGATGLAPLTKGVEQGLAAMRTMLEKSDFMLQALARNFVNPFSL